ncbi:MAG: DNA-3-methyladenine glycosylase I [Gemmatimonadaceae bacterium]
MNVGAQRCSWAGDDPLMVAYHDDEWGAPLHDDARLFELLTLEGAQAGLSWQTILRKREGYRRAFAAFDVQCVAAFTDRDVERLMADASIVRNRAKITSTITNARAILDVQRDGETFARYLWSFVDDTPLRDLRRTAADLPAETPLSRAISRDLKRRGFRFVGPTTIYSLMQACGMVDDHVAGCFRATLRG